MSSVHLSVCPSVTLVDQDHIRWKSWNLIACTISPTSSLFVDQRAKAIHLLPEEHGEIFGETRGGLGKSGVLEHKSGNNSETRTDKREVTTEGL